MIPARRGALILAALLGLTGIAARAAPVVMSEPAAYVLSNRTVVVRIDKASGELTGYRLGSRNLLGGGGSGYWSWVSEMGKYHFERTPSLAEPSVTADGPDAAAVMVRLRPQPGEMPAELEYHYALHGDDPALRVSLRMRHGEEHGPFFLGEARYAVKLDGRIFDHLSIDAERDGPLPSGADWDKGEPLNLKETRRIVTGPFTGKAEHKYGYSAVLPDLPAFGWCSTRFPVGFWLINPSAEYLAGGPTKMELTGHLDVNPGGRPVLLNMWLGSHYGGTTLSLARGERHERTVGPFLLYPNQGATPADRRRDALARAEAERRAWPGPREAARRVAVTGRIELRDPWDPAPAWSNLRVGLAAPGVDWQRDGKFPQFWTRADADGRFTLPHVPPGDYTLHAFADGVMGACLREGVKVKAGATNDLRRIDWRPERFGRTVWQIGVPDRTAREFRRGPDAWKWGQYLEFPRDFPEGVRFRPGVSDPARDWNYCQPWVSGARRQPPWDIVFPIERVTEADWTLRLAFCGAREISALSVAVNGRTVGKPLELEESAVMHRDAAQGRAFERRVRIPYDLLRPGTNTVSLQLHGRAWHDGVLYDAARLEAPPGLRVALAGDSTVCAWPASSDCRGWGQYLGEFLRPDAAVLNFAKSGRSVKTFRAEGLWRELLAAKPDVVMIQFGHNDSHGPDRPESTDPATTYPELLRDCVREARAAGAAPVLVTPMVRRVFRPDGSLDDGLAPYAAAMGKVAAEERVPVVDLHAASAELVTRLGEQGAAAHANAPRDRTHFNETGARAMAALVGARLPGDTPNPGNGMRPSDPWR